MAGEQRFCKSTTANTSFCFFNSTKRISSSVFWHGGFSMNKALLLSITFEAMEKCVFGEADTNTPLISSSSKISSNEVWHVYGERLSLSSSVCLMICSRYVSMVHADSQARGRGYSYYGFLYPQRHIYPCMFGVTS